MEPFADVAEEQILAEESCPIDQLSHRTGNLYAARRARPLGRVRTTPFALVPGYHFTLRDGGNLIFEHATLTQLTDAIRMRTRARDRRELMISAGGTKLISCATFSALTGLDMMSPEEELPSGAYVGSIAETSVTAMFARIQEHRSTGRLVIVTEERDRKVRTELQVVRGRPTHVASSEVGLETPWQLIRDRLVDGEDMRAAVYGAVAQDRPFTQVLAERLGIDVAKLEPRFAAERLEPIAAARSGRFAFLSVTPAHERPIARSVLPLLTAVYRRAVGVLALRAMLAPHWTRTFLRTTRFESWLPELGLGAEENAAALAFGYTRTLEMALARFRDERFGMSIAQLMIELGMIAPAA